MRFGGECGSVVAEILCIAYEYPHVSIHETHVVRRAYCDILFDECGGLLDDAGVLVNEIAREIDAGHRYAVARSETNGLGQFFLQSGLVEMDAGEFQAVVAEVSGGLERLFQGALAEGIAM